MEPLQIFIGTEPAQWLPTEVLKYSVTSRTQSPVDFHELKDLNLGIESIMYTGFSFYRFYIPEACQYKGRAIYLDADIVVLCDIKEIFELEMKGKGVLSRPRTDTTWYTSVMLLDCEKLKHWDVHEWMLLIENKLADYRAIMSGGLNSPNHQDFGNLEERWNHLDEVDDTTKILHYTYVPTQPWKKAGHPYAGIFLKEMKAALDAGVINEDQVKAEIESEHVYPEILDDVLGLKS